MNRYVLISISEDYHTYFDGDLVIDAESELHAKACAQEKNPSNFTPTRYRTIKVIKTNNRYTASDVRGMLANSSCDYDDDLFEHYMASANCDDVGTPGHSHCGICTLCKVPRIVCNCSVYIKRRCKECHQPYPLDSIRCPHCGSDSFEVQVQNK